MFGDLIVFELVDADGLPLTGATWDFVDYCTRDGTNRTPQAKINAGGGLQPGELGGGLYGFIASLEDLNARTVYLIETDATPHRLSGALYIEGLQFAAWHLEDEAGALWGGLPPTVAKYVDSGANDQAAPDVEAARSYLFSLLPTDGDLVAGRGYLIDTPAGAVPSSLAGGFNLPTSNVPAQALLGVGQRGEYRMKTGDTRAMPAQIFADETGEPLDLAGVVSVVFTMAKRDGTLLVNEQSCVVTDEAEGRVEYRWAAGQTDVAGFHRGEFKVTFADGTVQSSPSSGYLSVVIADAL